MDLYDTFEDVKNHIIKVNPNADLKGDLHYSCTINNKALEITLYNVNTEVLNDVKELVETNIEEIYFAQSGELTELDLDFQKEAYLYANIFFSTALEYSQEVEVIKGNW